MPCRRYDRGQVAYFMDSPEQDAEEIECATLQAFEPVAWWDDAPDGEPGL